VDVRCLHMLHDGEDLDAAYSAHVFL
jgi:hypothetical protein